MSESAQGQFERLPPSRLSDRLPEFAVAAATDGNAPIPDRPGTMIGRLKPILSCRLRPLAVRRADAPKPAMCGPYDGRASGLILPTDHAGGVYEIRLACCGYTLT
jgi:hypothetical protein